MGYTYKKKSLHATERERTRCVEKRVQRKEAIKPKQLEHLIFLDESGVSTLKSTTALSSIRLTGEKAFTTYTSSTTAERFIAYLRDILISTLRSGDIVVMDNMRSHQVMAVGDFLRKNSVIPLYLPPYSPDLNPI